MKTQILGLLLFFAVLGLQNTYGQDSILVNVPSAGGLSATIKGLGHDATKVKTLILSGNIDVRDFKFMRDSMLALAVLNMENVQIKSFYGTLKGSHFNEGNSYAANEIPFGAFSFPNWGGNKTLISVKLPGSITSIAQWAFGACYNLSGPLNLPPKLKNIGSGAYESCPGLTGNLIIPESVETIRFSAFVGCDKLTGTINIPASVRLIEDAPFTACSGITEITVSEKNPYFISEDGILYNKAKTNLIQCPAGKVTNSLTIPDKIEYIGMSAFSYCKELSGDLIIPNSVKTVEGSAFQNCSGFNGKLVISKSVSSIGPFTFKNCSGLKGDIIIPHGVTKIDYNAFYGCTGFDGKLVLPSSLNTLEKKTFYNCSGLQSIQVFKTSPIAIYDSTFAKIDKANCELVVPTGSKVKYQVAAYWKEFTNIKEMPLITFSSNGGSFVSPTMADVDFKIPEPGTPTKSGYVFTGWYKESNFITKWDFNTDVATENMKLYAKWDVKTAVKDVEYSGIKIFPNPAKNLLNIDANNLDLNYKLINLSSATVLSGKIAAKQSIDVSQISKGTYLLCLYNDKLTMSQKVIVD